MGPRSVVLAEQSLAVGLLLVLRQQRVEAVVLRLLRAVDVVPPVAHEVLLVEDRAVRTEEGGGVTPRAAHVE